MTSAPILLQHSHHKEHHPGTSGVFNMSCQHDGIYRIASKYLSAPEEETNDDEEEALTPLEDEDDTEERGHDKLVSKSRFSCSNRKNRGEDRPHGDREDDKDEDNKNTLYKKDIKFEGDDEDEKGGDKHNEKTEQKETSVILDDILLVDFGIKYRIIVVVQEQMQGRNVATDDDHSSNSKKKNKYSRSSEYYTIFMHMGFVGWDMIEQRATKRLKELFGEENVLTTSKNTHSSASVLQMKEYDNKRRSAGITHDEDIEPLIHSVARGHDICIKVMGGALPDNQNVQTTCSLLSNIRILVLGYDLKMALQFIARSPHHESNKDDQKQQKQQQQHDEQKTTTLETAVTTDQDKDDISSSKTIFSERRQSFAIPIQRPPIVLLDSSSSKQEKKPQFMVVFCRSDRVTVVIPFIFHSQHETDAAIARVFLQQFEQAQRKCLNERNGKNVPICEYRRSNDPPSEIKLFQEEEEKQRQQRQEREGNPQQYVFPSLDVTDYDGLLLHHAGYLSLTFLEHHVDNEDKIQKAVSNILMTYDFLDYHLKSSKSYIRSRMRSKKDVLMKKLFDDDHK